MRYEQEISLARLEDGAVGSSSFIHIKYSDDLVSFTSNDGETPGIYLGIYTDNKEVDSMVFSDYTWQKIVGAKGEVGTGIESVSVQFYLSTSKTEQVGGAWLDTRPSWAPPKYLWTRNKIIYKNPSSTVYTTPICDSSWEVANEVDNKVQTLQTEFKVEQGKITQLIQDTTIEGQKLKDKYLETVATVDGFNATIKNMQTDVSGLNAKVTEIKATADGVQTVVTANKAKWDQASTDAANANNKADTLNASMTEVKQTADKINLIVKSGNNESNLILTDKAMQLVADNINLKGLVNFSGLDADTQNKIKTSGEAAVKLSSAMMGGKLLTIDPTFKHGNWVSLLENSAVGEVSYKPVATNPTPHKMGVVFKTTTVNQTKQGASLRMSTPVATRANAKYLVKLVAKLPGNTSLLPSYNNSDVSYKNYTELHGTNKFEEYIWEFNINETASTSGGIGDIYYLNNNEQLPNEWIVSSYYIWDVTDCANYEYTLNAWTSDAINNDVTTINGGYIKANTINTKHLIVEDIFATGSSVMNIINAQEINAGRITSGKIYSQYLSLYDLEVKQKDTEKVTLGIDNNGNITMRGTIESYNYVDGKLGWAIKNDGNAEFNEVSVRGSVITNDGGIASGGGAGINLLQGTGDKIHEPSDGSKTNAVADGFKCWCLTPSKNGNKYTETFFRTIKQGSQTIDKTYTFSCWFKAEDITQIPSANPMKIELKLQVNTGVSGQFGVVENITNPIDFIASNNKGWIYATYTFKIKAPFTSLDVKFDANYFAGNFYIREMKMEEGAIATPWSLSPLDTTRQVRFWAGTSYEERDAAPFKVYNTGEIEARDGSFSGVFTGDIKIGNISIVDPNETSGGDALLTIQNGQNGVKVVQLRDSGHSDFAQELHIVDNAYNNKISLTQDGSGLFSNSINIGDGTALTKTSLTINGHEISTNINGFEFLSPQLSVGSAAQDADLKVYGNTYLDGSVKLQKELNFNDLVKCTITDYGLDWDFI